MTVKKWVEQLGLEESALDEVVHEAASQMAAEANNGGHASQIEFLLIVAGWSADDIQQAVLQGLGDVNPVVCKYCGVEPEVDRGQGDGHTYVSCATDFCEGREASCWDKDDAVAVSNWNRQNRSNHGYEIQVPGTVVRIYYCDPDDGSVRGLGSLEVEAPTPLTDIEQFLMDQHWDSRLDSTSCVPRFKVQKPGDSDA